MNEFIWRSKKKDYEPYEQSRKEDNPNLIKVNEEEKVEKVVTELKEKEVNEERKVEKKEIIDPNTFYDNNGIFRMSSSKREEVNLKMNDRELISQRNQNPFLVQNSYIEDLDMQQSFLMPKNSNFGDKKNL